MDSLVIRKRKASFDEDGKSQFHSFERFLANARQEMEQNDRSGGGQELASVQTMISPLVPAMDASALMRIRDSLGMRVTLEEAQHYLVHGMLKRRPLTNAINFIIRFGTRNKYVGVLMAEDGMYLPAGGLTTIKKLIDAVGREPWRKHLGVCCPEEFDEERIQVSVRFELGKNRMEGLAPNVVSRRGWDQWLNNEVALSRHETFVIDLIYNTDE